MTHLSLTEVRPVRDRFPQISRALTLLCSKKLQSLQSKVHNARNIVLCLAGTFTLFVVGSIPVLSSLAARFLPRNTQLGTLALELGVTLTIVISIMAIPLGFIYMYFFGGVLSTRAIKLYLFVTKGKHVITSKMSELEAIRAGKGLKLSLRRQVTYFAFVLAVVGSFAVYLAEHKDLPIISPLTRTTDAISLITQDFITLTMSGSLMIPAVALALPYFGGLRLRTIDAGPFHTTILSLVVGLSGGYTIFYSLFTRPAVNLLVYYIFLFSAGVCWCFAIGCNLAADPANRHIVHNVLSQKTTSKLVSSKIWLENPPGQFREV